MTRNVHIPPGLVLIALCLALLGAPACKRSTQNAVPFPASNEASGWARSGEIRTFPAADLWKYIDGEAERYLKAGVQSTSTADYRFHDKSDAVVDVYTMGSAEGSRQILDAEPAANAQSISVGDTARLYSQSLVFRRGPYLVRITAYDESAETQQALLVLAHAIEQRLSQ